MSKLKARKSRPAVSSTDMSEDSQVEGESSCDDEDGDDSSDGYVTDRCERQQVVMVQQPAIKIIRSREDDVVDWFDEFEKVAAAQGWNRRTMVKQAPLYFQGQAESAWKRMAASDRSDYKALKDHMLRKLKASGEATMVNEYNSLAQAVGESPAELAERLQRLVDRCRKLKLSESETSQARTFVKALRVEIGAQLVNENFKTLERALKKAERIDRFLEKKMKEDTHSFNVSAVHERDYQYGASEQRVPQHQGRQHSQKFFPPEMNLLAANNQYAYEHRQETDGRRRREGQYGSYAQDGAQSQRNCFRCGDTSHWVKDCPQPDPRKSREAFCGFCFVRGHVEQQCKVLARRKERGLSSNNQASVQETQGPGGQSSPTH